jgi:CPA2 family monovalent cation:H+ antiporter-2
MHDLTLLINVAVALTAALLGGLLARRLGLPTLVGYLLAGVAIGPFTPGFVGHSEAIAQLAELGVVFLMFGVGLHFSLGDLARVRRIAVPGALGQMTLTTVVGAALGTLLGWPLPASLVMGIAVSIASTVVLLRGFTDAGLLDTRQGRLAVGWLVVEDLAAVVILLVLPSFAREAGGIDLVAVGATLLKAGVFVGLMLFVGARVVPFILLHIARTRSRELFVLVALMAAAGTALAAASLFGVSLALGAFLAGVVVSESPLSHQVGADVLPFREAFSVLFFVSVGMLVDPGYLVSNAGSVLALTLLILLWKALAGATVCAALSQPVRTSLLVGTGIAQIGEFSFIVGRAGVDSGMLRPEQYSLILASAVLSITVNPFMFRSVARIERVVRWVPWLGRRLGPKPQDAFEAIPGGEKHVVVVGCGRVGGHIVDVLASVAVPRLVVESDAEKVEDLHRRGIPVLFGDAANSDILKHARLESARALVVTIPDDAAAALVVAGARQLAPELPVVARASTQAGVKQLGELGARDVIHPELEGGLEIVRHTLLRLGFPRREIRKYTDVVRSENYDTAIQSPEEYRALNLLLGAAHAVEVSWVTLASGNPLAGRTLADAKLRTLTGASVVAIRHDETLIPNPPSDILLHPGDQLALIGESSQVAAAESVLTGGAQYSP